MLPSEIIAVSSGIHTKYINTFYVKNAEFQYVNTGGTQSNQQTAKCWFLWRAQTFCNKLDLSCFVTILIFTDGIYKQLMWFPSLKC